MLQDDALVWINGELKPLAQASVSVADHGLVVGDAAFETLQIVQGVPFAITRHIRRLHRTLAALGIGPPDDDVLRGALTDVVAANGLIAGRVRLTVTAGLGPLGSGKADGPTTVVAAVAPPSAGPAPQAVTVPWTRNEMGATSGLKTTSYAENVRALRYAHDQGAGEALFANTRGDLCEGTGTNVFVVLDGTVHTPPLASGCLAGVTRELVLEVADVVETALPLEVLETAEEVFLTSSLRDVQGISRVDRRDLVAPGPLTADLAAGFLALKTSEIDP